MADTRRKVQLISGPRGPEVWLDGKLIPGVNRVKLDYTVGHGPPKVEITLLGMDINLKDIIPKYLVRVIGPEPDGE